MKETISIHNNMKFRRKTIRKLRFGNCTNCAKGIVDNKTKWKIKRKDKKSIIKLETNVLKSG